MGEIMCPEELIALVSALSIAIAKETSREELAVYSSIFSMLGEALGVYLDQTSYLEDKCKNKEEINIVC